jgi:hypothetical protein
VLGMLRQCMYGLKLGWEDSSGHGALRCDVAMCRLEKWADRATAWRLHGVLVEQFITSFRAAPDELVLNFDATDKQCLVDEFSYAANTY